MKEARGNGSRAGGWLGGEDQPGHSGQEQRHFRRSRYQEGSELVVQSG